MFLLVRLICNVLRRPNLRCRLRRSFLGDLDRGGTRGPYHDFRLFYVESVREFV